MKTRAAQPKLVAFLMAIAAVVCALVLLTGCVAANEPASSDEENRGNDGGEATKAPEEQPFNEETAKSTETERVTIPTHWTVSKDGQTVDTRYNIGSNGCVEKAIIDTNGSTLTMTYAYDQGGKLTGGTLEANGESREFTSTETIKTDGANVKHEVVSIFSAPPANPSTSLANAADYNAMKIETDYTIDAHGHAIEFDQTINFDCNGKSYERSEDAEFNEDGLIVKGESHFEDLSTDTESGDFDADYTYKDDNRTVTKFEKRDDGDNQTTEYTLAYNEAGELFRIAGGGLEATIEYYETPATAMTASMMAIHPVMVLMTS